MLQAAFISYAVFLALFLLAVFVVFLIIGVRSLLAFIRGRSARIKTSASAQPPTR
jgi:hypothetical protein